MKSGYFATEEAEKAAKWDMVVRERELAQHLAVLKDRAAAVGRSLEGFGAALRNESWIFQVREGDIKGHSSPLAGVPPGVVSISEDELTFGSMAALLLDIAETTAELERERRNLAEAGIA
jgi:hypothetical protein